MKENFDNLESSGNDELEKKLQESIALGRLRNVINFLGELRNG